MTFSGPGGRPAHSPNFFHLRRASTRLLTLTCFFASLNLFVTRTFCPFSLVMISTTVLMSSAPASDPLGASFDGSDESPHFCFRGSTSAAAIAKRSESAVSGTRRRGTTHEN
eukprot:Mycagemm_TRINITY_DN10111_c0_g1::TRINITY_DN10111_c0_g1_i1::g.5160::m.5160 type:complete len:112 gc:universal TRINITY_DN10111_c0_g1_i1:770-1105(+)